ncbi:MAG: tetratricopeptide repeat protein, partial [Alphaproteobacteria bacterium]
PESASRSDAAAGLEALPWVNAGALCRGGSGRDGATGINRRTVSLGLSAAYAAEAAADAAPDLPPLLDGLGPVTFPISSDVEKAQAYFNQGLRLTYGFNHREAERAFRAAEALDPTCGICAWGVALVLGPNINAPMFPEAVGPAFSAIARAQALAKSGSAKELDLITALATRYSADPKADRAALDRAYADAMMTVAGLYPDDDDIATLAAEAIMDLSPWDYWTAEKEPKGRVGEAVGLIEKVLERNPDHIGAIHLYIHLMEVPRADKALPFARRLAGQTPASGHLVHMPSHITYRLGLYKESLESNIDAVKADEMFLATSDDQGLYRYVYYPHNVHFLMTSAQLMGDRKTALANAVKLSQIVSMDVLEAAPIAQAIAAAPLLAEAQFGAADAIMDRTAPDEKFPFLTLHWHFARARAFIVEGKIDAAKAELARIDAVAKMPAYTGLDQAGLPASLIGTIAEGIVRGRIAWAEGNLAAAAEHLTRAAEAQDLIPYMEPPFWHIPVRQTLGAVHLAAGNPDAAEKAFRRALMLFPNNAFALHGLAEAYEAQGKEDLAGRTRTQFEKVWAGDGKPGLKDL